MGEPLSLPEQELARAVGVSQPDLVRVEMVSALPLPSHPALRQAAVQTGLMGPGMVGLTLGHAIFICHGHKTRRLLSHELRHVHQYERYGSIGAFLREYLAQIVAVGYQAAPLEVDARRHEIAA